MNHRFSTQFYKKFEQSLKIIQVYYTLTLDSCCPSAYNCTDVVYEVHDAKNQLVAHVTKHWGGGAETCKGKFNNI